MRAGSSGSGPLGSGRNNISFFLLFPNVFSLFTDGVSLVQEPLRVRQRYPIGDD
jgi:hypothetical protein